jgi:hypothetical protein
MGEVGRRRVQEGLAWEYSVPHLLAAYQRCFAKNTKFKVEHIGGISQKTEVLRDENFVGR